jgi:hypothetical protein
MPHTKVKAYQIDALKANNLEPSPSRTQRDDKDFTGQLTKIMATQPEVLCWLL